MMNNKWVLICCLVCVGCSESSRPTSPAWESDDPDESRAADWAMGCITILAEDVVIANIETKSVSKINRPAGYGYEYGNNKHGNHDYLVKGEFFYRDRDIRWWVVVRHHDHGGMTNEGWGFDLPPKTQEEIDARVSINKSPSRFP